MWHPTYKEEYNLVLFFSESVALIDAKSFIYLFIFNQSLQIIFNIPYIFFCSTRNTFL